MAGNPNSRVWLLARQSVTSPFMAATRREALEAVERLWDKYPDMRLGQLVINIAVFAGRDPEDAYDLENEEAVFKHLGPE